MEKRKPYHKPVSELILFDNNDVITTSGTTGGVGWNNNGNGNGNGHWFEDGKPGNGGHKD